MRDKKKRLPRDFGEQRRNHWEILAEQNQRIKTRREMIIAVFSVAAVILGIRVWSLVYCVGFGGF